MAIGEIGLDFHYDHSPRDVQREWFRRQIRLANELKMPIAIHSREADQEVLDILKEEAHFPTSEKAGSRKDRIRPDMCLSSQAHAKMHACSCTAFREVPSSAAST